MHVWMCISISVTSLWLWHAFNFILKWPYTFENIPISLQQVSGAAYILKTSEAELDHIF